jgi:hypothetical protein
MAQMDRHQALPWWLKSALPATRSGMMTYCDCGLRKQSFETRLELQWIHRHRIETRLEFQWILDLLVVCTSVMHDHQMHALYMPADGE